MGRSFKVLLASALAALLTLGLVAPSGAGAQTAAARVKIKGGTTTLTTAPGLVDGLLASEIVALVTAPGTQSLKIPKTGSKTLVARYPVSGGSITTRPLAGTIRHRGGLFVQNVGDAQKRAIAVGNFVIDLKKRQLTAQVIGTTIRLPMFNLNLTHAKLTATKHLITISRIGASLTARAAAGLNQALGTTVFKKGLKFGTAVTKLRR